MTLRLQREVRPKATRGHLNGEPRSGSLLTLPPITRMHGRCRARHTGGGSCSFTPLFRGVVGAANMRVFAVQAAIEDPFISDEQAHTVEDRATHDDLRNIATDSFDNPRGDLALALARADVWRLARSPFHPGPDHRAPMPVSDFAANLLVNIK